MRCFRALIQPTPLISRDYWSTRRGFCLPVSRIPMDQLADDDSQRRRLSFPRHLQRDIPAHDFAETRGSEAEGDREYALVVYP